MKTGPEPGWTYCEYIYIYVICVVCGARGVAALHVHTRYHWGRIFKDTLQYNTIHCGRQ